MSKDEIIIGKLGELEAEVERLSTLEFIQIRDPIPASYRITAAFLSLPFLRCYYPGNVHTDANIRQDLTGSGYDLVMNGSLATFPQMTIVRDRIPTVLYSSTKAQYDSHSNHAFFNVAGNEADVHPAYQGFTVGTIFQPFESLTQSGLVTKWAETTAQRQYVLQIDANGYPSFSISSNGIDEYTAARSLAIGLQENWNFIIGRFDPGVSVEVFHNGVWTSNTTSIPALIGLSGAPFQIGRHEEGFSTYRDAQGFICHSFLCAGYVNDDIIDNLYRYTEKFFSFTGIYEDKLKGIS